MPFISFLNSASGPLLLENGEYVNPGNRVLFSTVNPHTLDALRRANVSFVTHIEGFAGYTQSAKPDENTDASQGVKVGDYVYSRAENKFYRATGVDAGKATWDEIPGNANLGQGNPEPEPVEENQEEVLLLPPPEPELPVEPVKEEPAVRVVRSAVVIPSEPKAIEEIRVEPSNPVPAEVPAPTEASENTVLEKNSVEPEPDLEARSDVEILHVEEPAPLLYANTEEEKPYRYVPIEDREPELPEAIEEIPDEKLEEQADEHKVEPVVEDKPKVEAVKPPVVQVKKKKKHR